MIDLFCIASGPSLTAADCELVRQSGIPTVAVNNSWEMAPFCKYLYAADLRWWDAYHTKITIPAERWTCKEETAIKYKINYHKETGPYNSGMRAIQFGISKGFKSIALLGYDCSLKNGIHWHGPHTEKTMNSRTKRLEPLRNPSGGKLVLWDGQFRRVAAQAIRSGVKIVNCSRYTELKYFTLDTLERVLGVI